MENPINPWMIWGYHYFWKHPIKNTQWRSDMDRNGKRINLPRGRKVQITVVVPSTVLIPNPICRTQLGHLLIFDFLDCCFGKFFTWGLGSPSQCQAMLFEGPFKLQALGNLKLKIYNSAFITQHAWRNVSWHSTGKNDGRQWHKPNTTLNNNWNSSAMIWTYMTWSWHAC